MPNIVVRPNGTVEFIYTDELRPFFNEGQGFISRASHVEPEPTSPNRWWADMSPVEGPQLGPFETRQEALDAEVIYLNNHVL